MIQYFLYYFGNICKPQNENGIMIKKKMYISKKRYLKSIFFPSLNGEEIISDPQGVKWA